MEFVSFLPNFNFYYNEFGRTTKFRITKMTRCYITIHMIDLYGDIKSNQRIKIRTDSDGIDYIMFKHSPDFNVNKQKIISNKITYTDEN